jgi:hypothetical protein
MFFSSVALDGNGVGQRAPKTLAMHHVPTQPFYRTEQQRE